MKIISRGGTSSGGTANYTDLQNKPSIDGVELNSTSTKESLDIASKTELASKLSASNLIAGANIILDKVGDTVTINSASNVSGGLPSSMFQKTSLNPVINTSLSLTLAENIVLDRVIIQSYKFVSGTSDIIQVLKTFDNTEKANFNCSTEVTFDGAMSINKAHNLSISTNADGYRETALISRSEYSYFGGVSI